MTATVAFLGLGRMGLAMAGRLQATGFNLRVYNRTASRCAALAEQGAVACATPAEAVAGADFAITMLADDSALLEVALGEGGFARALSRGAVHLSMSTVSPYANRRIAEVQRETGSELIAVPVVGRPEVAEQGKLWLLPAGPPALEARCKPLFEALGRGYTWLGDEPGLANVAKTSFNFLLFSTVETLAEAFALVEKQGGDSAKFLEMVSNAFGSPIITGYGNRMLGGAFQPAGFTSILALKDISLMLALGEEARAPVPAASLVRDQILAVMARGREEWDVATLLQVARERAGLA